MLDLEPYEEEVLVRMYDKRLIGMDYKPIQVVRSKVNWEEIARTYRLKKSFEKMIRHLSNKGYVDTHGKGGNVASLTRLGVSYVRGILLERKSKEERKPS
ncbi:MAG: hypothetical protein HXX80_02485 [Nitrososphaerales archaeon]|nr:hypothetical protein [Nitrososphaerales archaeon]